MDLHLNPVYEWRGVNLPVLLYDLQVSYNDSITWSAYGKCEGIGKASLEVEMALGRMAKVYVAGHRPSLCHHPQNSKSFSRRVSWMGK